MFAGDMAEMDIRIGSTQEMLTSLLYRFGSQLVKLDISFEELDPHLLENIEGAAYKLENFKLMSSMFNHAKMETLLKFGLFQHLRLLHLVSILNDSLICLKELTNLKELTLDGPKFNHIKLNDVLDLCYGLECLDFIRCQLSLQFTSNAYSLITLKFSNKRLPRDINTFISSSHLRYCIASDEAIYAIDEYHLRLLYKNARGQREDLEKSLLHFKFAYQNRDERAKYELDHSET